MIITFEFKNLIVVCKCSKTNVDLPQKILWNKINGGKLTMIYDLSALKNKYHDLSNINQKISLETKKRDVLENIF